MAFSTIDYLTYVLTPSVTLAIGWFKYLATEREKHKEALKAALDQKKIEADAEVQKEKIRVEGEVEKVREKSVGAEAIVKIWKEFEVFKGQIGELETAQNAEITNRAVMKEIVEKIKHEYDRLVELLWEKFLKFPS